MTKIHPRCTRCVCVYVRACVCIGAGQAFDGSRQDSEPRAFTSQPSSWLFSDISSWSRPPARCDPQRPHSQPARGLAPSIPLPKGVLPAPRACTKGVKPEPASPHTRYDCMRARRIQSHYISSCLEQRQAGSRTPTPPYYPASSRQGHLSDSPTPTPNLGVWVQEQASHHEEAVDEHVKFEGWKGVARVGVVPPIV